MGRFGAHPYLTLTFWMNPKNQYWEKSLLYSEETKQIMRDWLAKMVKEERHLFNLEEPIKNGNNV